MRDPVYPERRIERAKQADRELVQVLEAMLQADETISDHAVATRMTLVSASSAICRDEWRKATVAAWSVEQNRLRDMSSRWGKTGRQKLALRVETDRAELDLARSENVILRAGIVALIRSIGEGGVAKWRKSFDGYEKAFRLLDVADPHPTGNVVSLRSAERIDNSTGDT